jgi:hypothetical protein
MSYKKLESNHVLQKALSPLLDSSAYWLSSTFTASGFVALQRSVDRPLLISITPILVAANISS